MAKPIHWQIILDAIASAEAKQIYHGYRGRAHHWSLEAKLSANDAAGIMAYMEAHGASVQNFEYDMRTAFNAAGNKWKFNNKVLPILIMVIAFACLTLIGAFIQTNVCLGFLVTWLIFTLWFLKNHRFRRLKGIWKAEGSIEERLDKMCAISTASPIRTHLIPLLIIAIIAAPLAIGTIDPKLYPYMKANSQMNNGEYDDAIKAYAKLGNYKDSQQKLNDAYNAQGDAYMEKDNMYRAMEYYEKSGDETRIASAYYAMAEDYLADGDFERAVINFRNAGDYLDAQDRAGEVLYTQAEQAIADGDIRTAIEKFTEAGDYLDAQTRIGKTYYDYAEAQLAEGEAELAAQQFALAGEYEDAAQRSADIYARLIADSIAAHDFATAARIYTDLGDEAGAQNILYQEAVWHYESGNYGYAYLCFSKMADYVPETGRSVSSYLEDEKIIAGAEDTLWMVPGNIVVFGTYEQDNDTSNGEEDLEWVVMDSDGTKSLLMTRYVIDTCHEEFIHYRWAQSTCREWLNSTFLTGHFTDEELNAILTTRIKNGIETSEPNYGIDGGEDTEDRVFLLSYQEALHYLGKEPEPPVSTPYGMAARGILAGSFDADSLLRSVGFSSYQDQEGPMAISWSGHLLQTTTARPKGIGVQPVIWVDLDAVSAMEN